jgi:acyl-coenzyme A thioesterase PaaI-like protein
MSDPSRPARPGTGRPAWRQRLLLLALNLYPPFLGAGIRIRPAARGDGAIEARMRLAFWNRNVVGTHYGGSLYSMCDPFFVLILRQKLGPGYTVWDKWASIRFRRPGRGTVSAVFHVPDATAAEIRGRADRGETVEPRFEVEVVGDGGEVVAVVEKLLHVRLVKPPRAG